MEVEDVIKNRRSVREYLDREVDKRLIAEILEAGRYAPSSGDVQNWQFIIVENIEKKKEIAIACLKQLWMVQAPVFIVVCNKVKEVDRMYGERGVEFYARQNCAACIENMLLKATDLGLASCWVGAFDEEAITRILKIPYDINLNIPADIRVEAIITIGYSDEEVKMPSRYTINITTYFEEWGNSEIDFGMLPLEKQKKKIEKKLDFKRIISKVFKK